MSGIVSIFAVKINISSCANLEIPHLMWPYATEIPKNRHTHPKRAPKTFRSTVVPSSQQK